MMAYRPCSARRGGLPHYDPEMPDGLRAAQQMMRADGAGEAAVAAFTRLYERALAGDRGVLPSAELEPVTDVPGLEDLPEGRGLGGVAMLKLNGGLGTTMGLDGPKSLVEVKPGMTFLDVIARQARALGVPLVLMNSFATRTARVPGLSEEFLQSRVPRLRASDLAPLDDWAPPGHGDLYASLEASGMRARLREHATRWAFVSNADNLGALPDPRVPAWMAAEGVPFVMEVVEGTEADRKGGHIARRNGRLVLRETAQTPPEEAESFGDFRRWRHYNANNLWLDLERVGGDLDLPLIVNRKTVDGVDVVQLETAMGAALGVVDGARALRVPRSRFVPVKTTDDLLVVRSDFYALGDDGTLRGAAETPPFVSLDPRYFRRLADFERRFPHGPPSLANGERLVVEGDVTFP
jgi:UTP--glucose-1-phosphate uridylyltransferase